MKLRLLDNSLRFRLSQSEVRELIEIGHVEAKSQLGIGEGQVLGYTLKIGDSDSPLASFAENKIEVSVVKPLALDWAEDDDCIGITQTTDLTDGKVLRVLIEKDFTCLSRGNDGLRYDGEDDSDSFPNPNSSCDGN